MAHRAALYTIRVRPRGEPQHAGVLLGDIDDNGSSLLVVLEELFDDFSEESQDRSRVVRCLGHTIEDGTAIALSFHHGQSGIAADLLDPEGHLKAHQYPEDDYLVKCGALFRLPARERSGWLAVHINHGRGITGLLRHGLIKRFRARFPDLILVITPYVDESALQTAIDQGLIEKVSLVRIERPDDRALQATDKWIDVGQVGRIQLEITARERGARIVTDLLKRWARNRDDPEIRDSIIEFEGIRFDEAMVEVDLPDGGTKTFNLEHLHSGHPITVNLSDLTLDDNGEPTDESLVEALKSVVGDMD